MNKNFHEDDYVFKGFGNNSLNFKYVKNIAVNNDIINYIHYTKKKDVTNMLILLNSVYKKRRLFYLDDDYQTFEKYRYSLYKIKKFLMINRLSIDYQVINTESLELETFQKDDHIVELINDNKIYKFKIEDLLHVYKYALHKTSKNIYLNHKMEPPKNPYTNLSFTLKDNIIIFDNFTKYYMRKKCIMPAYLSGYQECYYDVNTYFIKYYFTIMIKSVSDYVLDLNYRDFYMEFLDMVDSNDVLIGSYCSKCYSKLNLREIFTHTVILFILNSNRIYIYGNYTIDYIKVAKKNNIFFDKYHQFKHRKKIKKYNLRSLPTISRYPINNSHSSSNLIRDSERITSEIIDEVQNNISALRNNSQVNSNLLIRPDSPVSSPTNFPRIHTNSMRHTVSSLVNDNSDTNLLIRPNSPNVSPPDISTTSLELQDLINRDFELSR